MAYKDKNDPRNNESKRKYYYKNKEMYLERNRVKRKAMCEYVNNLKQVPCMDCKVQYPPYVMDFDHRDPSVKTDVISKLKSGGSWNKLLIEIEKCDIVCSNCHRERTFSRQSPMV